MSERKKRDFRDFRQYKKPDQILFEYINNDLGISSDDSDQEVSDEEVNAEIKFKDFFNTAINLRLIVNQVTLIRYQVSVLVGGKSLMTVD